MSNTQPNADRTNEPMGFWEAINILNIDLSSDLDWDVVKADLETRALSHSPPLSRAEVRLLRGLRLREIVIKEPHVIKCERQFKNWWMGAVASRVAQYDD